jgi:hypothetical protein
MTTLLITIAAGLGAVFYFIRIGKKLQKSSSLKAALNVHGKINREKAKIEEEYKEKLAKKGKGNPRDFFNRRN